MAMKKKSSESLKSKAADSVSVFPEKELRQWLKNRTNWDHKEWLELLKTLREKGYAKLTDSESGRTQLGQFLEAEKNKHKC